LARRHSPAKPGSLSIQHTEVAPVESMEPNLLEVRLEVGEVLRAAPRPERRLVRVDVVGNGDDLFAAQHPCRVVVGVSGVNEPVEVDGETLELEGRAGTRDDLG